MSATAAAADTRIAYFEPIAFATFKSRASAGKTNRVDTHATLTFQALGRTFTVNLQPNPRFIAISQRLQADASRQVLQGTLQGEPDSWVRLTQVHGRLHGMIRSQGDVYVIEPVAEARAFVAPGIRMSKAGTVIFRLSDTYSALGQSFCASEAGGEFEPHTELDAYTALVDDLKTMQLASQASGASKRLDISALGDASFLQRFNSVADAEDAVLARLNNVDGIFSAQLGVTIQVPSITIFSQDPTTLSTSTAPNTLLDSLGRMRSNNADLRSRGVTHLFTGRDLDGSTVGIAYTKSLCDSRYSASLTESRGRGTWTESLIAAHEIGHNFGAIHDGSGACSSTPQTFLMAPSVNGSSTFSQCSLDSMQPMVQSATCLITVPHPDISLATDLGTVQGYAQMSFDWLVKVTNAGDATSNAVQLDFDLPASVQVLATEAAGGSCSVNGTSVTCNLGSIGAKATTTVKLTLKSDVANSWPVSAAVSASDDADMTNNTGTGTIAVEPAVDLAAALTVDAATSASSKTVQFSVTNNSDVAAASLVADLVVPAGFAVTSIALEEATCTAQANALHCTREFIPAHTTVSGSLQLTANAGTSGSLQLQVESSDYDPDVANNMVTRTISMDTPVSAAAAKQEAPGGGGGACDWLLLYSGGLLTFARSRRLQPLFQPSGQRC